MSNKIIFFLEYLYVSEKSCTFASQKFNKKIMIATPARERGYVPMMGKYESEVYYTRKEFMDELAKQVGQAYGLNDIREAK